jgi:hypothetical protein
MPVGWTSKGLGRFPPEKALDKKSSISNNDDKYE